MSYRKHRVCKQAAVPKLVYYFHIQIKFNFKQIIGFNHPT